MSDDPHDERSPGGGTIRVTDGSRVYVEERGDTTAPPVLFLPGGPGMGCDEFLHWQGDLLSNRLRLVGLDPRGVLRSDPLRDDEPLTDQMLVDDCEDVRAQLGIDRWVVLGHSFGARIALRYAVLHPERVRAVIFENPGWDFVRIERYRLPRLAAMLDDMGDVDAARRCRALVPRVDAMTSWDPMIEFLDTGGAPTSGHRRRCSGCSTYAAAALRQNFWPAATPTGSGSSRTDGPDPCCRCCPS